ncbi:MAG: alpha/beta hydrolase fold domain-containing protein [Candidatus Hydrogenedens sp.]|nr:alpha/beta hydrolase fold domain-containing protein [Candidatus Hydrogenedens sp.]
MKWVKRILKVAVVLVLLVLAGGSVYALSVGRAPAQRPDLVTPLPPGVPAPPAGFPSEITSFAAGWFLYDKVPWENAPAANDIVEKYDIEYGTGDGIPLSLDLYLPDETGTDRPGIVLYYGGGWKQGSKDQLRVYAQHFARHGYVVAAVQYRLKGDGLWPKSIHDAKCAVRWMRAHAAEYGIDKNRIGVSGNSAGAYLALMVAYTPGVEEFEGNGGWPEESSAVQAVVDIYGPADFTEPVRRDHPLIVAYMNGHYEDDPSRFERASPIRYVTSETVPTCVIHGTVDMLVPVHQSDWLVEKLEAEGVPHFYSRIDGWPHAMDFIKGVNDHTKALMLTFFDEYLKNGPGAMPAEAPAVTAEAMPDAA